MILSLPLSILLHAEAWSIGVQAKLLLLLLLLLFHNGVELHVVEQTDLSLGQLVLMALVLHAKSSMAESPLGSQLQRLRFCGAAHAAKRGLFLVVAGARLGLLGRRGGQLHDLHALFGFLVQILDGLMRKLSFFVFNKGADLIGHFGMLISKRLDIGRDRVSGTQDTDKYNFSANAE